MLSALPSSRIKGLYMIPNFLTKEEFDRLHKNLKNTTLVKHDVNLDDGPLAKYSCFLFGGYSTHPCILELSDKIRRSCNLINLNADKKLTSEKEIPDFNRILTNDFFSDWHVKTVKTKQHLYSPNIGDIVCHYNVMSTLKTFERKKDGDMTDLKEIVPYRENSLFILSDEARNEWSHSLPYSNSNLDPFSCTDYPCNITFKYVS